MVRGERMRVKMSLPTIGVRRGKGRGRRKGVLRAKEKGKQKEKGEGEGDLRPKDQAKIRRAYGKVGYGRVEVYHGGLTHLGAFVIFLV